MIYGQPGESIVAAPEVRDALAGMIYAEPLFSRPEVDLAGQELVTSPHLWAVDIDQTLSVVNNWRRSHGFPLNTFQVTLKSYARTIESDCLVAQRIKRIESIKIKLARFNWLKLSEMQDLGGCRAVMKSVGSVRELAGRYLAESRIKHKLVDQDDYIAAPKKSGYRGIHLIYQYHSDRKATYNGLKIELQLRSLNMHAWATAVETVDTFSRQGLKAGQGTKQWQRFFALMASHFAWKDGTSLIPNTPTDRPTLVAELRALVNELQVFAKLTAYQNAVSAFLSPGAPPDAHYYVLQLDATQKPPAVTINAFTREKAQQASALEEQIIKDSPHTDVVLVAVDSIDALHKAYPNYFLDTKLFLLSVREVVTSSE